MAVSAGNPWLLGFIPGRSGKPHHHISGDPLWGQYMNVVWQFCKRKKKERKKGKRKKTVYSRDIRHVVC
jgi:hypothetical protein